MMDRKKILSGLFVATISGSSFLPWITHAYTDFTNPNSIQQSSWLTGYSPATSTKRITQFLAWEKKILDFMNKDYAKVVIKLKNANAKKAYTEDYWIIKAKIHQVFLNAEGTSDYMFSTYVTYLRKEIKSYKELRKELVSLEGSSINPLNIPSNELAIVENDMIDLQKVITSSLKKTLDSYDVSDFKETGKIDLTAEWSFGKVHITAEKYMQLLSILTRSQEVQIAAKADFSINMPGSYAYNTSGEYVQTEGMVVTGNLSIDGTVKIIDQDVYLSLRDYSLTTNLTGKEKEVLNARMQEFASFKGKTVKIPLSSTLKNTSDLNQAKLIGQLKKVLSVLETNSLFTPYKKIGEVYSLTLKQSTFESIASIYNQKIQRSDIDRAKMNMKQVPLLYTVEAGKKTLFVRVNEPEARGLMSLSKEGDNYSFLVDVMNPSKNNESIFILLKKAFLDAKIIASGVNVIANYKDKNFTLSAEWFAQNLKIEWILSDENSNINAIFNGKKIGNITWKKLADTYTYDISFEIIVAEILSKFHINGENTTTKGTFPILAPTDFIEVKNPNSTPNKDFIF